MASGMAGTGKVTDRDGEGPQRLASVARVAYVTVLALVAALLASVLADSAPDHDAIQALGAAQSLAAGTGYASPIPYYALQHAAAPARFLPLVDTRSTLDARVAALNANADYRVPTVAVLGMGEDGHTASIFADAPEWDHAITTQARFVAVHPGAAPHARVSYSLDALKRVDRLFLLIAGPAKREVLDAAAASLQKNAISQPANDKGTQLDVYWCAK